MKEAAIFWMDYLSDDGKGHLVSSPSYSPEQGGISTGATMDHEIAWDILTNTIEAAKVLNIDADFAAQAQKIKDKILPLANREVGAIARVERGCGRFYQSPPTRFTFICTSSGKANFHRQNTIRSQRGKNQFECAWR